MDAFREIPFQTIQFLVEEAKVTTRFVNGGGLGNLIRKRCRTKPIIFIFGFVKIERSVLIRMMLVRKKTMVTRITSLEPLRRKQ